MMLDASIKDRQKCEKKMIKANAKVEKLKMKLAVAEKRANDAAVQLDTADIRAETAFRDYIIHDKTRLDELKADWSMVFQRGIIYGVFVLSKLWGIAFFRRSNLNNPL